MIRTSLDGIDAHQAPTVIIGSGPAGLTLALELARLGQPSLVLESGVDKVGSAQDLSEAQIVEPRLHDGMDIAVSRRFGGTSNLWGGRCIPLDAIDFEPRPFAGNARWPISYSDLAGFYETACRYANCGRAEFIDVDDGLSLSDRAFSISALERASNIPAFQKAHRAALESSRAIEIYLGATVVDFDIDENGRATGVHIAGQDGRRFAIKAGRIVLAAGGLEATRLLLSKQRARPEVFGGPDGPLGRYYMGHVIGEIADVVFTDERLDSLFDFRLDGRGSFVRRRFSPSDALLRREDLPNISFWPVVPPIADARHRSGSLSAVALALSLPGLGGAVLPEAIRKRHLDGEIDIGAHLANVLRDLPRTVAFLGRFAYRRYLSAYRISGYFVRNQALRYGLSYSSEQSPRADSRVTLLPETDRLGLPRLRIDYRCHVEDAQAIARAHAALEDWLGRTGLGRVEYRKPKTEAVDAIAQRMGHGTHQIGTARMGATRQDGVVDGELRTFDCPNLFVLSSAVFPTSGQANPTLSIVAFAARLAQTLARDSAGA